MRTPLHALTQVAIILLLRVVDVINRWYLSSLGWQWLSTHLFLLHGSARSRWWYWSESVCCRTTDMTALRLTESDWNVDTVHPAYTSSYSQCVRSFLVADRPRHPERRWHTGTALCDSSYIRRWRVEPTRIPGCWRLSSEAQHQQQRWAPSFCDDGLFLAAVLLRLT